MTEQSPINEPAEGTPTPEDVIAKMVDADQLAKMRATMARFKKNKEATESGSEAVAETPEVAPTLTGPPAGKDVDWSEYDLPYDVRHLYKMAQFRETPQGTKWVAMVDEFYSTEKQWRSHGKRNNRVGAVDKTETESMNLGEWLNDMLNGPEGWTVVSLLPGTSGLAGVLLRRPVPVVLPDPKPLKKETEVAAPTDPELQKVEDAALAFAAEEGFTPPAVEQTEVLAPTEEDNPKIGALEAQALAINPPTERLPGQDGMPIPDEEGMVPVAKDVLEAGRVAGIARLLPDFEKKLDDTGRVIQ